MKKKQCQSPCGTQPGTDEVLFWTWIRITPPTTNASSKSEWCFSPLRQMKMQSACSNLSNELVNTSTLPHPSQICSKKKTTWCHWPSRNPHLPVNVLTICMPPTQHHTTTDVSLAHHCATLALQKTTAEIHDD